MRSDYKELVKKYDKLSDEMPTDRHEKSLQGIVNAIEQQQDDIFMDMKDSIRYYSKANEISEEKAFWILEN